MTGEPRSVDIDIDIQRYRRVRAFFLKVVIQALWWDVLINRPLLRRFRPEPIGRWRQIAREFRALAVEMGGVLIKLGQFLSIRVDILPMEITRELSDLQDEVPPESFDRIKARIALDFGRPADEVFAWISPVPVGAASLAQVHAVRLDTGERAVSKVLRPGIEERVAADLAAVKAALAWLKWYEPIRRRIDPDWLYREFSAVTRKELDFSNEGQNAERLAEDTADDPGVYIPKIYWSHSAGGTLTLEDVGFIKIGDVDALRRAGIDPARVADRLYALYMRQVFETHFVHVDPHPGNLFVRPLPLPEEFERGVTAFAPGDSVPCGPNRPFQIVFVDFGMMIFIPERLQSALRDYAVGLGTRDARRIVASYLKAGTLLPHADLQRLEAVHEALLDRFWGVQAGRLHEAAIREARYFAREYSDVILNAPFQFQADMLFVIRAVGILSGMAAHLDPEFDVWSKTIPYARRYAASAMERSFLSLPENTVALLRALCRLPRKADAMMDRIHQGRLVVRMTPDQDGRRVLTDIGRSVDRLANHVLAAGLLVSGAVLFGIAGGVFFGKIFMITGGFVLLLSLRNR
ncbi:ABC1 kinase family protein [Desulfococcus sp.]|uniref:ABC1 kinase family protein n=1 Tax=Desulfococcus sp. TaxID=2025834 RepID=UPI003D0A0DAF